MGSDVLLVVIDIVKGFIIEGTLADKNISKIIPPVVALTKQAIKDSTPIVAFVDTHNENSEEFKIYPPHCLIGTNECELVDELMPFRDNLIIIHKDTIDGFQTSRFTKIMFDYIFSQIIVVGCCTDICVKAFTTSLLDYIKQRNLPTKIHVVSDCVYTFDAVNHKADEVQTLTLQMLADQGAIISTSEQLLLQF